jgi:hypothetical protein
VFGGLFAGHGRRRRDPATAQIDKVLDGWICGSAAGGFSCSRLGAHGKILPINPRHLGPNIDAEALRAADTAGPASRGVNRSAVALPAGGLGATSARANVRVESCGSVLRYDTSVGERGASCRLARRVARRYLASALGPSSRFPRNELGFRCRRITTVAAGGWYTHCRKGRALVAIVPQ